jgi:hypothetical protein
MGSNPIVRAMARSSYVYVVMNGDIPVAGFTVKHELVTWLGRNPGDYVIYRLGDKGSRPPVIMTL